MLFWKDLLDILQRSFTIIAIIVGALWGYSKYFRGRTFRQRIELDVSADKFVSEKANYIIIKVQAKNVGLSKIDIDKNGADIEILSYDTFNNEPSLSCIQWEHLATVPILKNHDLIEPGEVVREQELIEIPGSPNLILKIFFRIVSNDFIQWESIFIINIQNTPVSSVIIS